MACEGGYQGTAKEFAALVESAANDIEPMDMDAVENGLAAAWVYTYDEGAFNGPATAGA